MQQNSPKATFNYTKPPAQPEHLYVVESELISAAELALLTSLQGLTSKTRPSIYILPQGRDSYRKFLEHMNKKYRVSYTMTSDVWALVDRFRDAYDGYILYDMPTDVRKGEGSPNISINIATSLCGIRRALLVDAGLEEMAVERGIKKLGDVRDKTYEWLLEQPEYGMLAKNLMVELAPSYDFVSKLRDYAIMCNAICYYDPEEPHTPTRARILADLEPDTPVLGWGSGNKGEDKFIDPTSEAGHYYIPADHGYNVSILSAFNPQTEIRQKNHQKEAKKAEKGKHYVTLVMSDGDNLQYALTGLDYPGDDKKLYDSEYRGKVHLAWGIPSSIVDLAAFALDDIYNRASDGSSPDKPGKDYFVTYCAGGYMYPSRYPSHLMEKHAEKLSESMKKADARILGIIDFDQYNIDCMEMWDHFTRQENIDAVFYVDYCSYHTDTDQMLWSNGKPIIASKARFWEGLPNSDIESIARKINSAPTDPSDPNSYSLIMVHCWSKYVKDVVDLVQAFAPHVEVVPIDTFVQLIKDNVDRTKNNGYGVKSSNKTFLYAPLDLGNYLYPVDEAGSEEVEINHHQTFEYIDVANSPNGLRYGTKVSFKGPGAVFRKKFLDPMDIYIGTKLEMGIFSEDDKARKIKISFYNSSKYELFNFHKDIEINFKGWKFFSINIPFDLVATDTFEISAVDGGDFSLLFSEMALRYKAPGHVPGLLEANISRLQLNVGDSFDISCSFFNIDIEEFSLSGALYYKPIRKNSLSAGSLACSSSDSRVVGIDGNKITALSPGEAVVYCDTVVDGRKYRTAISVTVI